eukprot:scaffold26050_cov53-Phaeocystis_antarctica.AAC.5
MLLPPTAQLLRTVPWSRHPPPECFDMTAAPPPVLSFWLSHLVATLLASATERCGSSGRTPSPDGGAWRGVGEEHRVRRARRWCVGRGLGQ